MPDVSRDNCKHRQEERMSDNKTPSSIRPIIKRWKQLIASVEADARLSPQEKIDTLHVISGLAMSAVTRIEPSSKSHNP